MAVAWARGEATARTAEIPRARIKDLDLERARVWIGGSSRTASRWGDLTEWGALQLRRRQRELGPRAGVNTPLAATSATTHESRVSISTQTIGEVLKRAGVAGQHRIGPASLAGWAGVRIFKRSGYIDVVARAMGIRSLDAAARVIGWEWRDQPTDAD